MCGGPKPPRDNSAAIAQQQEAQRQARITQGQQGIDAAFAGFDDPFYQDYTNKYTGYYMPQLDDQYSDAVKRLTLQLAQSGNLTGSVGAKQLSDLQKYYDTQKLAVTNQASTATQGLRSNIDTRKSQLYADNRAAADPGSASAAAASAARALQPTAPSSPLANVFADFFGNLGNAAALNNARAYQQGTGVQSFGKTNTDSVKVYGDRK
jgi:hypothetical protein